MNVNSDFCHAQSDFFKKPAVRSINKNINVIETIHNTKSECPSKESLQIITICSIQKARRSGQGVKHSWLHKALKQLSATWWICPAALIVNGDIAYVYTGANTKA
jgi:hypothetical protein